jgi:hypothetical protein
MTLPLAQTPPASTHAGVRLHQQFQTAGPNTVRVIQVPPVLTSQVARAPARPARMLAFV